MAPGVPGSRVLLGMEKPESPSLGELTACPVKQQLLGMGTLTCSSAQLTTKRGREGKSLLKGGMRRSHGKIIQIALTEGALPRSRP